MDDHELASRRTLAFAVAYRMLGGVADAEDVAQEAVARLDRAEEPIANPDAWITTVATRLAIDELRSARARREAYVGPWLPEPLLVDALPVGRDPSAPSDDPADRAVLADSLSQALLVALERLTPVERAAFLLREVFDYDYGRIAEVVDRTEVSARQLVARAKKHVAAGRPRFDPDDAERDRLLERFLAAAEDGDAEGLEELLAADAVLWADGGGAVTAARRPVHGAARVAVFLRRTAERRRVVGGYRLEAVRVNGQPGVLMRAGDGAVETVLALDVVDGRIAGLWIVRNPAKLAHLA